MDRDIDLVNDILADLANFRLSVSSSQPRHRHGQQYGAGAGAPGADLSPFTSILPSIISHTHGRERREERQIDKRELQEAVKYGKKEVANPGRNGQIRHKFTHKGVIYITDETGKHEITSWRMDEANKAIEEADISEAACSGSHTVIVVDASGSMRKEDVPGYKNRTQAVYDCLRRDFLEPQLAHKDEPGEHMVSLLEMSDETAVIFKRAPISDKINAIFRNRGESYAKSHGNYLPMLDAVTELLLPEMSQQRQLFLIILSDGAPSDHIDRACAHGVNVWHEDRNLPSRLAGKKALNRCTIGGKGQNCRQDVIKDVREECLLKIVRLGDLFGRDRMSVSTVAFGPPSENFDTLQQMAKILPRGSFQKLGLSAQALHTAFSSLTSSLTSLRSDAGTARLTERKVVQERKGAIGSQGWDIYKIARSGVEKSDYMCYRKERWNVAEKRLEKVPFEKGSAAVAHSVATFGCGAERQVYHFYEVDEGNRPLSIQLTAKTPKHLENMSDHKFMVNFCRVQAEAQQFANLFNRRTQGRPSWQVNFVECVLYTLTDPNIWVTNKDHVGHVLAEPFLEGKFQKWNNNAGAVKTTGVGNLGANMGVIGEDDEADEVDLFNDETVLPDHAPQAFSHFTYVNSEKRKLVCDLQGVWNEVDGYVLTDPVIHHTGGKGKNGRTDKGVSGVSRFFETHQCNPLCRRLGLEMVRMEDFSGKSIGLSGARAREERAEHTIAPGSHMPALIR